MLKHLITRALALGLVKIIHVQLTDKRREVVMFEILRKDRLTELVWLLDHKAIALRLNPANDGICLLIIDNFI
jgi:hypothetical protein